MNVKFYIDRQRHHKAKLKPYRLRVMQGKDETVSMYFETEAEATRAKLFARKLIKAIPGVDNEHGNKYSEDHC